MQRQTKLLPSKTAADKAINKDKDSIKRQRQRHEDLTKTKLMRQYTKTVTKH
jgi:hypothetical protein